MIASKQTLCIGVVLASLSVLQLSAQTAGSKGGTAPLMIQEQGSFAVSGSVTTAPGTFDPIKQGNYDPTGGSSAGQALHGDHAFVFYQVPVNRLVFLHGTGRENEGT